MSDRISSEEDLSSIGIDVCVDPASPGVESPCVCSQNLKPGMYEVAFLIIVFPGTQ